MTVIENNTTVVNQDAEGDEDDDDDALLTQALNEHQEKTMAKSPPAKKVS